MSQGYSQYEVVNAAARGAEKTLFPVKGSLKRFLLKWRSRPFRLLESQP